MRIALILTLALSACAASTSEVKTPQGQVADRLVLKNFHPDEIAQVVLWMYETMEEGPEGEWTYALTDNWIKQYDPDDPSVFYLADGVTYEERKLVLIFPWQGCIADTALVHEIFHVLGYPVHDPVFGPRMEELITTVQKAAVGLFCPEDYVRPPPPPPNVKTIIGPGEGSSFDPGDTRAPNMEHMHGRSI